MSLSLSILEGAFAVCRLEADGALPAVPASATFWSLTRAGAELSLVCAEHDAPADAGIRSVGWRILVVDGPLDLGLTGILAAITEPLAGAGVPIFPIATHDTDWILVAGERLDDAVSALRESGIAVSATA